MATEKRLIDANALTDEVLNHPKPYRKDFYKMLRDAPTVDAVEVVRCKDCAAFEEKYHTAGKETGKVYCGGYCYHWDYEQGMSPNQVDGDDFCSYGERRTDAD